MNVDLYAEESDFKCDLKRLEMPDNYASVAVAIHVIEHFYEWEAPAVLKEWMRVLEPGGSLVLELPCMDKVLHYITKVVAEKQQLIPAFSWWAFYGDPRQKSVPMTHKWGYTKRMIKDLLESVGYVDVTITKPRYHFVDRDMRVEARKPL